MAKLIDVNGLKAVVQKINADTKDIRVLLAGKADVAHEHAAVDVKFDDGKNLVEKLAEIQTGGQVDLTGYATQEYVQQQLEALIGEAPEALDTLKELAAALGDNADFASTMVAELAKKVDKVEGSRLITQEEAAKLAGLENYNDAALAGRVAALEGIDHSAFAKAADLANKVDKEDGKVLIAQTELDRLAGLHNYNDAALVGRVAVLEAIDHNAFLKAEDIAGKADAADLQALAAEVGDPAVEAAEGVEAKAATGLYKYVDDKVAAAAVEVATVQELEAMYEEVKAGEPQV